MLTESEQYPKCFGPYLRYAISTDFSNFEEFDAQFKLFFLVEFHEPPEPDQFLRAMNQHEKIVDLGSSDDTRYATMLATMSALTGYPLHVWDEFVSRVELSLPLKPTKELKFERRIIDSRSNGNDPAGKLLIGVLDDGCPFAAAQFLENTAGGLRTRVRAIWDQNTGRQPINVKDKNGQACVLGQTLSDLTYGLEFRRVSHLPGPPGRLMGLNEWIDLHVAPQGGIDEDGCYAGAGFPGLAHEASHGAHVMDVVAGRLPPSSRTGPPSDRRDPPSWKANTDPASATDVVFVQFSEACIRDATGVWLKSYVYDAILYILSHADQHNTDHVVINLSYGPTTGPHDGLADLEPLLTTFVKKYDGIARKPKLDIVLAAGNSYLSEGHVRFHRHRDQPDSIEWTWRLPPDNTTLCFAEIWVKRAYAGVIDVTLVSPSGVRYRPTAPVTPPPNPLPPAGVDLPIQWSIDDTMWQLHVDPTVATAGVVAEHGDWTIQLANVPEHVTVHAYVARTDPNMNVHSGARRSFFVDAEWERSRAAEASCKYVDGMFDKHGSLIRRHGTLNGIATAKDDAVHVAGGYILSNERKSSYSSAGRARPGPLRRRIGPDYLLPCDDSYALSGVLAGGNRSGSVFRLIGTSTAAPQLARHIVNAAAGWPFPVPHVPVYPPDEERGLGNLDPP